LTDLGWNLIRIWATEWYQHPASCAKTLLDAVEAAKKVTMKKFVVETNHAIKIFSKKLSTTNSEKWQMAMPAIASLSSSASLRFVPYICCKECSLDGYDHFAFVPDSVLSVAIVQIVSVEGPILVSVLIVRIKELGRVPRMTRAFRDRIISITSAEIADGRLFADPEGFLTIPDCTILPRERPVKWSPVNVSLAEITVAAVFILEKQFSTTRNDLIRQTALSLGFKATTQVKNRVAFGIDAGIAEGSILLDGQLCKVARTTHS
jgi:hypothetical protein